jgi:PAS domain S-box-containing protein
MVEPQPEKPETTLDGVASLGFKLAQEIAEILGARGCVDLRDQLQRMALAIAQLSGIPMVMVAAFDEDGLPLTAGAEGFVLRNAGSELEGLFRLHQLLEPHLTDSGWIEVDPAVVQGTAPFRCLALPIRNSQNTVSGLVLVGFPRHEQVPAPVLQVFSEASLIVAMAIQSAIRADTWNRIEALQKLAQKTFDPKEEKEWDLQALVNDLSRHFNAGAVTLLLKDQEELRLAASTDPHLGTDPERPVIYQRGEGLTGYVFKTGQPLQLRNTKDIEEIRLATGLDRKGPMYPERDKEGSFTGQFLGVPLRFGGKVVGVLRMSRRRGVVRFTREDQKSLQFFGDFLGAALAPTWYILLEQSVVESVTEAIAVTRREESTVHRFVMVNPGAAKLLGRSEEEIQGLEASEIYAPGEYERLRQPLQEAITAHETSCGPFHTQMKRPDGSLVPVTIAYQFLSNHLVRPPTLYTIGLAHETTESERLAAQHERLLDFFATLGIAYFQADQSGITLTSTKLDSEITGYSSDELKKMSRKELYDDLKYRDHLFEKARENQGKAAGVVVKMRRKDGEPFWAAGDLRIVENPGGQWFIEGFYRDVTARIRLQSFLNEDEERVLSEGELLRRLKQEAEFHLDYLSSFGHQLQTPLSALINTLRNLEEGVTNQRDIMDRLPYVIGQAVVCSRLVWNLSYMDKVLRGEPFQHEKISMAKLAIETKLDFIHLLREKRLDLIIDDDSLKRIIRVQGHQGMLRQVIVNLVDNAIKYSMPGTTIQIRARSLRDGSSLEISNLGIPIPEEDRERIFQRGYRTKKAQALIPHGTGLGLWLVRKIVEAHGATIQFHELDEGGPKRSLFRIFFPSSAD